MREKVFNVYHNSVEFVYCTTNTAFVGFQAVFSPAPPIRPDVHKARFSVHVKVQIAGSVSQANELLSGGEGQSGGQLQQATEDLLPQIKEHLCSFFVYCLADERRDECHLSALLSSLSPLQFHFRFGEKAGYHQLLGGLMQGEIYLPVYPHLVGDFGSTPYQLERG